MIPGLNFEPMSMLIDFGGNLVGLPPAVTSAAKIAVGACTGNVVCAANGAAGLVGELTKDAQATTEHCPPKDAAIASKGYSATSAATAKSETVTRTETVEGKPDPELVELDRMLGKLSRQFGDHDHIWFFVKDGVISREDLERTLKDPRCSAEMREVAAYFLEHPEHMEKLSQHSKGKWTRDGITSFKRDVLQQIALQKAERTVIRVIEEPAPKPPVDPAPVKPTPPPGEPHPVKPTPPNLPPVVPTPEQWRTDPNSPLASDYGDMVKHAKVLEANLRTFDSAHGRRDGLISRADLQAIVKDPDADPKLKEAAQFFLDKDAYFNRIESRGALFGFKDGHINLNDLRLTIAEAEADLRRYGLPPRSGDVSESGDTTYDTGGGSVETGSNGTNGRKVGGGGEDIRAILNDPSLSLEMKIQLILAHIAKRADEEILNVMEEMAVANDKLVDAKTAKKGDPKAKEQAVADQQHNIELLQQRLQKAMERRKQMYDLMSNMSAKFNEMAKTAIQNMARA